MKKIVAFLIIMIGCMVCVSAQDHEFNKTLRKAANGDVPSMYYIGRYYTNV